MQMWFEKVTAVVPVLTLTQAASTRIGGRRSTCLNIRRLSQRKVDTKFAYISLTVLLAVAGVTVASFQTVQPWSKGANNPAPQQAMNST
jgi:hypothetical protein